MDEKNYRLLELFGTIDDSYIDKAGKPWNRRTHGHSSFLKAACTVLIIAGGILGACQPQVNAAVQSLFSRIGQIAGREEAFYPYADSMEMSQTTDGITLTLQEVVMADNQLYAAFTMDTDLETADLGDFGISFEALEENIYSSYSGGYLDGSSKENGYVIKYSFADGTLPKESTDITLTVVACENGADWENSKKIPFTFTFSSSASELSADTLQLSLNQKIEIKPGIVLELETFSLNSIFSRIHTKCGEHSGSLPIHRTQYYLAGTDSLGNEVLYTYQAENGPYGYFATEETLENSPPSLSSEWVELQLYSEDIPAGSGYAASGMVPIGEKFRVSLTAAG